MNSKLLPLAVIDAYTQTDHHLEGITPFLKQAFLVQANVEGPDCYDFRAGDYGPFSHRLYTDIDRLVTDGFIDTKSIETRGPFGVTHTKTRYTLSKKGQIALRNGITDTNMFEYNILAIQSIVSTYAPLDPYTLLEAVYTDTPSLFNTDKVLPF